MKVLRGTTVGLASIVALILAVGALTQARPASAAGPADTGTHHRVVVGVDGSAMSIDQMHLSLPDRLIVVSHLAPAVINMTGNSEATTIASWRMSRMNRQWVQVSGEYCTNKSGGQVFRPDGAPVDPGLSC